MKTTESTLRELEVLEEDVDHGHPLVSANSEANPEYTMFYEGHDEGLRPAAMFEFDNEEAYVVELRNAGPNLVRDLRDLHAKLQESTELLAVALHCLRGDGCLDERYHRATTDAAIEIFLAEVPRLLLDGSKNLERVGPQVGPSQAGQEISWKSESS